MAGATPEPWNLRPVVACVVVGQHVDPAGVAAEVEGVARVEDAAERGGVAPGESILVREVPGVRVLDDGADAEVRRDLENLLDFADLRS